MHKEVNAREENEINKYSKGKHFTETYVVLFIIQDTSIQNVSHHYELPFVYMQYIIREEWLLKVTLIHFQLLEET